MTATAQAYHNAYMLIYEKRLKSDLKLVLNASIVEQIKQNNSLVCDGTTMPRDQLLYAYPGLVQKVLNNEYS